MFFFLPLSSKMLNECFLCSSEAGGVSLCVCHRRSFWAVRLSRPAHRGRGSGGCSLACQQLTPRPAGPWLLLCKHRDPGASGEPWCLTLTTSPLPSQRPALGHPSLSPWSAIVTSYWEALKTAFVFTFYFALLLSSC